MPYGPTRAATGAAAEARRDEPRGRSRRRARRRRRRCTPCSAARTSAAGFWSLLAGGGDRGRRPRELIDWAIGPVWEANHVWLIFVLVVLWTGFPSAFEAIFSTLFIPLSLAALGIVLRGAGFAFQHTARRARGPALAERIFGALVAADAVLHGHRRRRDRRWPRARRQRRRRSGDELAQPALAASSACCSSRPAPTSRPCSSSATRAAPARLTSSATSAAARSSPRSSRERSRPPAWSFSTPTRGTSSTA